MFRFPSHHFCQPCRGRTGEVGSSVPQKVRVINWTEATCPSDASEHQSSSPDGILFLQFSDYQNYVVNSCVKENPTMERSIALCNGISQWVQLMVLSRPTPQLRAEVFIKFIQVAQVSGGVSVARAEVNFPLLQQPSFPLLSRSRDSILEMS